MPFIDLKASCPISEDSERELKAAFGKAVELIPGKNESRLMIEFTDNCRLWFNGEQDGPIVMVNVMLFGSSTPEAYEAFKAAAISAVEKALGARMVYLKFEEAAYWYRN